MYVNNVLTTRKIFENLECEVYSVSIFTPSSVRYPL